MKTIRHTKGNRTMQTIFRVFGLTLPLALVLWLTAGQLVGRSYYYYQPFTDNASARAGGWTNINGSDQHMASRDGVFFPPDEAWFANGRNYNNPSVIDINAEVLSIYGKPNNNSLDRNSTWWGKVAQFYPGRTTELSSNFSAFATSPIGFYVTRTHAHIDYDDDSRADEAYHKANINVWLVKESYTLANDWDAYEGLIYFFEQAGPANGSRSKFGYYSGADNWPTTAQGPRNQAYAHFNSGAAPWNNIYDDQVGTQADQWRAYRVAGAGAIVGPNNNRLGIRFTHDGSRVRIYLNPNPDNALAAGTHPNEFFLFGQESVGWNTDMKVMIGHEGSFFLPESVSAEYDDFVVRTVSKTLTSSVTPRKVLAGGVNITYTNIITATFDPADSGIGEVLIAKPAYMTDAWQLGTVSVSIDKDNDGTWETSLTPSTMTMPATATDCYVMSYTNYDGRAPMLKIIFHSEPGSAGIIKSSSVQQKIRVVFTLATPALANSTGGEFEVYANLDKYREYTWSYAQLVGNASGGLPTTGMKKAVPATEAGVTAPDTTMTVRSYGQPQAFASVTTSPAVINQGSASEAIAAVTYEISTKGVLDRPAISQAVIELPTNAFLVTNASSLLISDDQNNIVFSQTGGKRYITLNYATDAVGALPGFNGYDRITFTMYGTPSLPAGMTNTNMVFRSTVNASTFVNGATAQYTGTNAEFPKQTVSIAADNPKVSAYIFPVSLGNATKTNAMTYTINNTGTSFNRVKKLRILINTALVESISGITSSLGGSVVCDWVSPYITVDYSALGTYFAPGTDTLSFTLVHKIPGINNPETPMAVTLEADNNNGKGWIAGSEDSRSWTVKFVPPDPKPLAYVEPGEFVTSDVTNRFKIYIFNNGPKGDKVLQSKILIPSVFTNFSAMVVSSSILGTANIHKQTIGGTNWIWLKYFDAATNIGSLSDVVGVSPVDEVTIDVADGEAFATNRLWFTVYGHNKDDAGFITQFSTTNLASVVPGKSQHVNLRFPPVSAEFDVQSRFTNTYVIPAEAQLSRIDSSTATNTVVIRIRNTGDWGNFIRRAYIELPASIGTNIVAGSGTSALVGSAYVKFTPKSIGQEARVWIDYTQAIPATNIPAGVTETITFRYIDTVSSGAVAAFKVTVENDRETKILSSFISGGSGSIEFFVPPARAAAAVLPWVLFTTPDGAEESTVVCTVTNTGGGSNKLTKTRITFPALAGLTVLSASNSHLGASIAAPGTSGPFVLTASDLQVDYTASPLAPGSVDRIWLRVRLDNSTTTFSSFAWKLQVDNIGTVTNETTLMAGGTKTQNLTGRPWFNVYETGLDDHAVLTSNISNTIRIAFRNSTNNSSQSVSRLRVSVPSPFIMPAVSVANTKTASFQTSGSNLVITYSTPLTGDNFDTITLKLNDDFDESETATIWNLSADYGDGVWQDVRSNGLVDTYWYTNALAIVLPPATAGAWLTPAQLFVDMVASSYSVTITNTGVPGNHIRLVEITPPSFITNVHSVVSTIAGATNAWVGDKLYLHYTVGRLEVGKKDIISFTGIDNRTIASVTPFSWQVRVANIADHAALKTATIPLGQTLHTEVVTPSFRSEFHLTPETLDTASGTNAMTLYIDNKSPQTGIVDSYIEQARVYFDTGIFRTNGIAITSARGATITLSSNYFTLLYGTPIPPKGGDQLLVTIRDSFAQGNTSTAMDVHVKFDTMNYFTNAAVANGTNRIEFVMPEPAVEFGLAVRDLYTTHTNATIGLWVTNRGSGSNLLERFILTIPGVMSNSVALSSAAVASSLSHAPSGLVNAAYAPGVVPGLGDLISLSIINPQHEVASFALSAVVSNSTLGDPAIVRGVSNILRIVTPPQSRVSPNLVDTTTGTNTVSVHINNTGSGDTAVLRARVKIPGVYNRVVSVASTRVTAVSITNLGNEYFVEYGVAAIANGGSDTLTFVLEDSLSHGTTNVSWNVQVDNGNGYAMTAESTTGAMAQAFFMPAVSAAGWLNTIWVYAANDAGAVVTNVMTLSISNTGRGSNNVYRARLGLPQVLSNATGWMSTRGGTISVTNGTNVYVTYDGVGFLKAGQGDTLRFTLRHSVNNALSFDYLFTADNDDGNGYVGIPTPSGISGAQQRLDVFIKEEDPEAYIAGAKAPYIWETVTNTTVYTMDDAAVLRYVVKNKSRRFAINSLVIPLSNIFTVEGLTSTLATGSATVSYTHATNTMIIRWIGTNFGQQMSDTLTLSVSYDKNALKTQIDSLGKSLTNTLTGRVRYEGSEQYVAAQGVQRDRLVIENARFGRIRGVVLPLGLGPTVTLKDTASESIATNIEGRAFQALVNTNTGAYVVDKIPPSLSYRLVVIPPIGETVTNNGRVVVPVNYDTLQVSGVSAVRNTVLELTNLIMVYGKLNKQATGEQQVVCPEDALTKLIVPAGTLFEGVSINISLEDMTDDQESVANTAARQIARPTDSTTLSVWRFKIVNLADNLTLENGFKKDVEIVLHYGDLTSQGWTDDRLGIWYWKPATKEWVFVGGVVDTATKTIKARVSYLHTHYAVMATAGASSQAIHSVKASPNPFTPGRGDGQFSNMKLSFAFARAYPSYEVKIFNMQGQLVQHFTRDGSYAQGEVFWDGKDKNGFKVRGGVYVYQIIAGSSVYSGSVLILR